ncbi:MAG: periplasmic heavy metal sensor [Candidatus Sericytochromatia bacterium]|nr:periplasmic heavy metal sensor [Candidatus Sericytochromatia bacterium]
MDVWKVCAITVLGFAMAMPGLPAEARREGRLPAGTPSAGEAAAAGERQEGGAPGPGLFRQLGLSEEQRSALRALRQRHQQAHQALRQQLRDQERELFRAMVAPDARQADVEARQQAVSELRGRLARARIAAFFEARALLTAEQLQRLPDAAADRGQGGRGRRPGGRMGRDRLERGEARP